MKKYYSIKELEKLTNVPDSTIRRYIGQFPDFFLDQLGGRVKKYEESAVKVLARIKHLFATGYGANEVDSILRDEFPTIVNSDDDEIKSEPPAIATAEDMAEMKRQQDEFIKQQTEFNKVLVEKLDEQIRETEELKRYIKESLERRDQQLTEQMNLLIESRKEAAATVEPEEEKKGFWARFLGK